jgi:putative hydrolase of the HAD superfamily
MTIKGVLFDLGNTLLYFDGQWPEVFARADQMMVDQLVRTGLALDREAFSKDFRERLDVYHNQREALSAHGVEQVDESVIESALERLYAASQEYWIPEADLLPMMDALKAAGYRLGVISNAGDDQDVQTLVDKAQICSYLEFVITSASSGRRKPDGRIFALGLQLFGLSPEEVVMVGDTLTADILGANLMGITSVWITRRADTPGNRKNQDLIRPSAEIETLAELAGLLASLD